MLSFVIAKSAPWLDGCFMNSIGLMRMNGKKFARFEMHSG